MNRLFDPKADAIWDAEYVGSLENVVPGIVDAHMLQWNPRQTPWRAKGLARVRRLTPRLGDRAFTLLVSQSDREYVLTPSVIARAYETEQYVKDISDVPAVAGARIDTVILADSHWRAYAGDIDAIPDVEDEELSETRYAISLPFGRNGAPRLGGLIVHGDPRSPNFATQLDAQLDITPLVRAVRVLAARHPDPRIRDSTPVEGLVASAAALRGYGEAVRRGLVLEVFVYSHQLYDVISLAREYPQATIVVDHIGAPVGASARAAAVFPVRAPIGPNMRLWRERVVSLAAQPNVVMKLSGLALPALGYGHDTRGNIGSRETLAQMIGPLVGHMVSHFGSERLVFGSNYPLDRPNATMGMLVGALADVLATWGDDLTRRVFRDNALRVYSIDDDPSA
ncbi:putative amidohydrolase [Gordonia otitidis NBRC 100426]|uniref:Amidohydrolase n=1 Tax=Gordonia otitidis (strain DSM 44809 / CCUG 52243 / JCM 12355 / NBRC 100426 / IFM 10032) TaxID=1108044 RepID=H5TLL8_GORO1|nr:putative amidohydrolase [Gordonia otitidis NBRC 100426]